jgi:hypothetical protein
MQRESTGVNGIKRKEKGGLSGDMAKAGSKIQKCENLAINSGVGHAMSEGGEKEKRKVGRPRIPVSEADQKKALEACKLGIPLERVAILCGFPSGNAGRWHDFLKRNPDFADQLEKARLEGELELSSVVRQCGNGWQGSAWLLERTRGYVARASLEHTGKGGKELSISGSLLGAFGGGNK